jgi:WD40 repeat protein
MKSWTIEGPRAVVCHPRDSRLAVAAEEGVVQVRDLATDEEPVTAPLKGDKIHNVAWSPRDNLLAIATEGGVIHLWTPGQKECRTLRGHTGAVSQVAFAPGGDRLVSAGADRTVRVWDVDSGQQILTLRGHDAPVLSVRFSPDGRFLVSGGEDQTLRTHHFGRATTAKEHHRVLDAPIVQAVDVFGADHHALGTHVPFDGLQQGG